MAKRWAGALGIYGAECGRHWYRGWLKRAKKYKPNFGESARSKIDVMRAQKQSPATIDAFFHLLSKIYAAHKELGYFAGNQPAPEDVYNIDEVHADPKKKHRKKLGNSARNRKFIIASGDRFPFHVTIVITTRADGVPIVDPMIIHAGKR